MWLASLRDFLANHKLSIQLADPCIPPLQREHDSYIMDHILQSNHYTKAEVRKLNYCRLYLQVVTVSDLTTTDGLSIDPHLLHGLPSAYSSRSALLSIHQERPSETEWKLWRRVNLLWSTLAGSLRQPLGPVDTSHSWTTPLSVCISISTPRMGLSDRHLKPVSRISNPVFYGAPSRSQPEFPIQCLADPSTASWRHFPGRQRSMVFDSPRS